MSILKGLSVLSGLNLEKMKGLSFPRDKTNCPLQQGVPIKRVSLKQGLTVVEIVPMSQLVLYMVLPLVSSDTDCVMQIV